MLYNIIYRLVWLVSLLPLRVLYVFSDMMYPMVRLFYRRKVVRDNLTSAFPEKSEEEIKKIERDFYHHICDLFAENIKGFSMSKEEMMKHQTFSGIEHIMQGYKDGKDFMFFYLGHMGNWEWVASLQYWMPGVHCSQVYHPLYNKVSDKLFLHLREQYGGECIPMKNTMRRILEMRREGNKVVVGLLSDQLPKWNSIHHFTPFLNHDTAVFTGSEQIAKKISKEVMAYYGHITREKRGHYHCHFIPMTYDPKSHPDYEITDIYMKMLEENIMIAPSQWLWTHKRWKRTKEQWLERQKQKANEE